MSVLTSLTRSTQFIFIPQNVLVMKNCIWCWFLWGKLHEVKIQMCVYALPTTWGSHLQQHLSGLRSIRVCIKKLSFLQLKTYTRKSVMSCAVGGEKKVIEKYSHDISRNVLSTCVIFNRNTRKFSSVFLSFSLQAAKSLLSNDIWCI